MHVYMLSAKCQPLSSGLNLLTICFNIIVNKFQQAKMVQTN